MSHEEIHDLATVYANAKLSEYQVDSITSLTSGNTEMSIKEIQYLKSAYDFAVLHLNE